MFVACRMGCTGRPKGSWYWRAFIWIWRHGDEIQLWQIWAPGFWGIKHLCVSSYYIQFFFLQLFKKKVEENGIDFNMICFLQDFPFFFSKERTAAMFWMVVFSPEEIRRDFWGTNRCSGNMLVGSSKSTSFQHQSRDRKVAVLLFLVFGSAIFNCWFGLGGLKKRCSFFQKQRLYSFFWFMVIFHPPTRTLLRPAVNLGPWCLRLLFKWSKPGCGLQIARMVGWCTAFSSDLWPRRLAGFGKKETYGLADFFEAYPEKTEKRGLFLFGWWI